MAEEKIDYGKLERKRKIALLNLGDKALTNFAATYLIDKSGDYGEAVNSAVEEFIYSPLRKKRITYTDSETGEEVDLENSLIKGSRKGGKRYTGTISEYDLIEACFQIQQQSIMSAKVEDVLGLMGANTENKKYSDKYLSELLKSEDEAEKKTGNMVAGHYFQYIQDKTASDALKNRAGNVRKGLEKILAEEEKEKK